MSLRFPLPILLAITLGASALTSPGTARADDAASFHMTDANVFRPEAGFEVMFGQYGDSALAGLQFWLQYPLGERWSFTGRLPMGYVSLDNDNDGLALGNLTLDATLFLNARHRRRATNVTAFRLSISAPTASTGGDGGLASNAFRGFYLPDEGLYSPNTTTIRLYGTWRTGSRSFFGQFEGGLQQLVREGADDLTYLRMGIGGGVRLGSSVVIIAEFIGMSDIIEESDGDDFWSSIDLGMRIRAGSGNISLRAYLPLEGRWRANDAVGVALGYEVGL